MIGFKKLFMRHALNSHPDHDAQFKESLSGNHLIAFKETTSVWYDAEDVQDSSGKKTD